MTERPQGTRADEIPKDEIRERAYDLWERHHRPDGFELEFWFMAERELRSERAARAERTRALRDARDASDHEAVSPDEERLGV